MELNKISDTDNNSFEISFKISGLILGLMAFFILWMIPLTDLQPKAHHLLAIMSIVIIFWMTEAIPLAVTALLGPWLCVVAGIGPVKEIFRSFSDPIVFLFLGSFLLAEAMLKHGLHRRIAIYIMGLNWIGISPVRLMFAFGGITGFISMWISNTATTAMMYPIAMSIISEMLQTQKSSGQLYHAKTLAFATAMLLMVTYAASIGGMATPVGTPPNLIGIGLIEKNLNISISFFQWMLFGLPIAVVLIGLMLIFFNFMSPAPREMMQDLAWYMRNERDKLGRLSQGEKNTLLAFSVTIVLWIAPGFTTLIYGSDSPASTWLNLHMPESMAALLGAILLFVLPTSLNQQTFTLTWKDAQRIEWGIILLFGGGLTLGELMFKTGLADWVGLKLSHGFAIDSTFGLIALFTLIAIIVSETCSNTASASMVVPIAIAVAQTAGVDPFQPALAACLGASMGFMLPVSTAPNAIVYSSGYIPISKMVRYGIVVDLLGAVIIISYVTFVVPMIMANRQSSTDLILPTQTLLEKPGAGNITAL